MGKAHPFFRFVPANVNGGFELGFSIQSDLLNSFYNEYSDGDLIGQTIGQAIKNFQNQINTLNLPANGGSLRLVYPKPYPTITGVQTLVFGVQNDQLYSVDSGQVVTIELVLNNGNVTGSTFSFDGPVSATGNYDAPLLEVELLVKRALEIYYQSGSAIFPLSYSFDRSTGIATSFIADASDWKLNLETGLVTRNPEQTNPFAPLKTYSFAALTPSENYNFTLIDRVINYTVLNPSASLDDLLAYAGSVLSGVSYSMSSQSASAIKRISIQFSGDRNFLLIGRYEGSWSFQRFFIPQSSPSQNFFTVYSIGTALPYEPTFGELFPDGWYSLEQIQFNNGCEPEDLDTFQMPIKTGDTYQFNIIPSQANLTGLTSCQIGLFDSEFNFVQEIGTASLPSCKLNVPFIINISGSTKDAFVAAVNSNSTATTIESIDSNGDVIGNLFVIPFTGPYGSVAAYADAVIAYINSQDGYSATYTNTSNLVFTIVFENLSIDAVSLNLSSYTYEFEGDIQMATCPCATQFQANVTIPFVPDGCYVFCLYNAQYPNQSIFAFSNSLQMNNEDCFSLMWEFGSADDAIIEGFEYFNGWMQRMRLPINGGGQKPKIEESIYRNSDGTYQRPSNYSDLTLDLQSDYLDLETRNAVSSATRCPILIFEDQPIFVSGDLDVATVQDFSNKTSYRKLAQMKFSALIQGYQPDNNGCIGC
jgi:hypothetical protein